MYLERRTAARQLSNGQSPSLRRCWRLPVACKLGHSRHSHSQRQNLTGRNSGVRASAAAPANGSSASDPGAERQMTLLDEPLSPMDVDQELWAVLDMCTDDELEALYNILHSTSPFSPIVKSLLVERDEPALVSLRGRRSVMHKVEAHFRFLAADSAHLLRGARPSYREVLLNVRDKLDIRCSRNLSTYDLETEIFLHVLHHCVDYVRGPEHTAGAAGVDPSLAASFATLTNVDVAAPNASAGAKSSRHSAQQQQPHGGARPGAGAGSSTGAAAAAATGGSSASAAGAGAGASSSSSSPSSAASPSTAASHGSRGPHAHSHAHSAGGGGGGASPNWTERVTAPFRLGGLKDLAPTLLNLAGVVTVTKVGQQATQQLAAKLLCSHLSYQAALRAATTGLGAGAGGLGMAAKGAVAGWGKQAMLEAAQRSLTAATARYFALRGALSFLGPLLWGWLAVDLALKAVGTDYARVVRAVFLLSQVRLVRTHGFVSSEMEALRERPSLDPEFEDDAEDYQDPGAAFF
ncbi:hypothetical protein PLESTB_000769200 [Pleodorina starrii]|uniref:Uncharacterized protein n=1 Tax=Pleodorina starrii TaxID=330485 RepID=A0A9W6BLJ8_9CHLO|nr:hypothetical protein PLESTM_000436100 [Pleodorina starrii]GLC53616.1 hypothetical protein PLESTB_000769200 [Pleodorina starrii]GLC65689.1 hypothetical protein PLESTF_000329200 [Pleodorina starrii]